jgi:hypothetical protein
MILAKMVPILPVPSTATGTADNIETHETVELEIAVARPIVGARDLAIEREEEADGEFGHRVRRIIGDPHDFDAQLLCRLQIDMIEACGACGNEPGAARREAIQHFGVLTAGKPAARDAVPRPRVSSQYTSSCP